jgi:poly(A) polymerase
MRITGAWLSNPHTQAVCAALATGGHQVLFVGGCVRNALLDCPVADIDLATDATPETVTNLAETAGFKVVPTGFDHGTVTVIAGGIPHEVTTFRRDVETFGRHATVRFSDRIEDDAARRDFTMNALYATAAGEVVDPLGGLADLTAQRVRFVGDAVQRITEDYLRILRFFRFHAWYGDPRGGLDADGLAACAAHSAGLETLSRERVGAEMRKLLSAPDPAPAAAAMAHSGVLAHVLPGASAQALPILVHFEGDEPPSWIGRLAVLGGEDVAERLRLSRAEATRLSAVVADIGSQRPNAVLGYYHDKATARDIVLARAALFETPPAPDWQAEVARGGAARMPVVAADLMPGLNGAALGARLKEIEARWIASDFTLGKVQLLA